MNSLEDKAFWVRYSYELEKYGFTQSLPCAYSFEAVDMVPQIDISKEGVKFQAIIDMNFQCQKKSNPGVFY